ncbi:DUF541 domain-containing protein [Microbacterium sp. MEC084]|uniref:SIMPL domain-containing protein n=1 Tax=Microbacterium sp. MEC084 TaxID=1963027 RepID=UPI00106F95C4|nr:SIMPL domain-containing protein [Microbacterium sp. MEC084]MCD1268217.1 DUF541 domain-containing protein [Microbacterium sp. MEC084]
MITITVEGAHRVARAAERGALTLEAGAHGDDRDAVVARHARLHERLAGIAHERRAAGTAAVIDVGSPWAWTDAPAPVAGSDRPAPVHHVTSTIAITYVDLDALAADVTAFAADADVSAHPVRWELSAESREHLLDTARGHAVRDAVRRARSYAAAIRPGEATEPKLVSVVERQVNGGGPGMPMFARAEADALSFTTPEIEVEAAIVATFEI